MCSWTDRVQSCPVLARNLWLYLISLEFSFIVNKMKIILSHGLLERVEWNNVGKVLAPQLDAVNVGFLWGWDCTTLSRNNWRGLWCSLFPYSWLFSIFFDIFSLYLLCYREAYKMLSDRHFSHKLRGTKKNVNFFITKLNFYRKPLWVCNKLFLKS